MVIGEDATRAGALGRTLGQLGFDVRIGEAVSDVTAAGQAAALLIDVCPDGRLRLEPVREVRRSDPHRRIVAMTAYPSVAVVTAALRAGADDCLAKPIDATELARSIAPGLQDPGCMPALPSLAQFELGYIEQILRQLNGNISGAARILKIRRSTLQRKLKRHPPVALART